MASGGGRNLKPVSECIFGNLENLQIETKDERNIEINKSVVETRKNTKLLRLINDAPIITTVGTSYHLSPEIGNNMDVNEAFFEKLQLLADVLNRQPLPCIKLTMYGENEQFIEPRRVTRADAIKIIDMYGNEHPCLIIYISDKSINSSNGQKYFLYQTYGFNHNNIVHDVRVGNNLVNLNEHISTPIMFNRLTIVDCPTPNVVQPPPPPRTNYSSSASGGGSVEMGTPQWYYLNHGGKKKQRKTKRHRKTRRNTKRRKHR